MKKILSFKNVLLFLLTITVIWLVAEVNSTNFDGSTLIVNQENGFFLIKTDYVGFPINIKETKKIDDGTQVMLNILNPLNIRFGGAIVSLEHSGTVAEVEVDLPPGQSTVTLKLPFIERGEGIMAKIELKEVYFKK